VVYEKSDTGVKWKLYEYVSPVPAQRRVITEWRKDLLIPRRADMDVFLRGIVKKSDWTNPDIDWLKGKQAGFIELRWRGGDKVPHRIGGYFPTDKEFVMLVGWTHNARKYDPPEALDTLVKRKRKVETGEATIREYEVITGRTTQG
jgi:hypothetical protein